MAKIKITIKSDSGMVWDEFYDTNANPGGPIRPRIKASIPSEWAKELVELFNSTARPGEYLRSIVKVENQENGGCADCGSAGHDTGSNTCGGPKNG